MRLSISAKIFVGFLVVLATFGGVATYSALTMRRLGDELQLVSRGYLELRLEVSELQTSHANLLKVLAEQAGKSDGTARMPRFVKFAIDGDRRSRLKQRLPMALARVRTLEALRSTPGLELQGELVTARAGTLPAGDVARYELSTRGARTLVYLVPAKDRSILLTLTAPDSEYGRLQNQFERSLSTLALR